LLVIDDIAADEELKELNEDVKVVDFLRTKVDLAKCRTRI